MPNFSHGSQYLLPWDCTLKVDVDAWDRGMDEIAIITGNVKPRRPRKLGENMEKVKLFVGFEYECPRGHRFMLQTPEKMLKYSGPGGPKDNAAAIVKSDMPLWFPCGCRSTPRVSGQLMRVHVVTPKAPIAVALNPRVQANVAETGFFHPGNRGQIQLTWGKYYILRLPYAYVGLSGPVYPPKEPTIAGRVLKNMITVSYCPV